MVNIIRESDFQVKSSAIPIYRTSTSSSFSLFSKDRRRLDSDLSRVYQKYLLTGFKLDDRNVGGNPSPLHKEKSQIPFTYTRVRASDISRHYRFLGFILDLNTGFLYSGGMKRVDYVALFDLFEFMRDIYGREFSNPQFETYLKNLKRGVEDFDNIVSAGKETIGIFSESFVIWTMLKGKVEKNWEFMGYSEEKKGFEVVSFSAEKMIDVLDSAMEPDVVDCRHLLEAVVWLLHWIRWSH